MKLVDRARLTLLPERLPHFRCRPRQFIDDGNCIVSQCPEAVAGRADEDHQDGRRADRAMHTQFLNAVDDRIERVEREHPDHYGNQHCLRILKEQHGQNGGDHRQRDVADVDGHPDHERFRFARHVGGRLVHYDRVRRVVGGHHGLVGVFLHELNREILMHRLGQTRPFGMKRP